MCCFRAVSAQPWAAGHGSGQVSQPEQEGGGQAAGRWVRLVVSSAGEHNEEERMGETEREGVTPFSACVCVYRSRKKKLKRKEKHFTCCVQKKVDIYIYI